MLMLWFGGFVLLFLHYTKAWETLEKQAGWHETKARPEVRTKQG